VEPYTVGALVIDLFDARTKPAIFRGAGSDTISDEPEKIRRGLRSLWRRFLKKFPPEAKG